MSDWFHSLPIAWMALLVFGFTCFVVAVIYAVVHLLAVGEQARAFKLVSPGMLPPLGIVFGLFVGFTAAQVWSDSATASTAVDREASALRSAALLAAAFPREPKNRLDALISSYIAEAKAQEWPLMAHRAIPLTRAPHALSEALQFTLSLQPVGEGQQIAQREIINALQNAMDARRQRIAISQSHVTGIKWICLYVQAACALIAIAFVHSDNRLTSILNMLLFATGVATAVLLIAAHDRPFIGEISVSPDPLLQVMPQPES
jgi:hypothetical protein